MSPGIKFVIRVRGGPDAVSSGRPPHTTALDLAK